VQSQPGGPSPASYLPHRRVESFYVLGGELMFMADERELRAEPGAWVQAPPGGLSLAPSGEAHFLSVQT